MKTIRLVEVGDLVLEEIPARSGCLGGKIICRNIKTNETKEKFWHITHKGNDKTAVMVELIAAMAPKEESNDAGTDSEA